jgi:hypothetical protein
MPGFIRPENRKGKKKKAQDLMPQRMNRFDGGWHHMLDEMASLSSRLRIVMLSGHVFMVSKRGGCSLRLQPVQSRNAVRNHPGTDGLELASQQTGKSHKERGIVWKNVSKA